MADTELPSRKWTEVAAVAGTYQNPNKSDKVLVAFADTEPTTIKGFNPILPYLGGKFTPSAGKLKLFAYNLSGNLNDGRIADFTFIAD